MPENHTISHEYIPPVDLRRFVQILLSEEVKGNKDEAERRTGIYKGKFYYHWKKSKDFRRWYADYCDEVLRRGESLVAYHLMRQVESGEIQAIKLYYELIGRINNKAVVNNTILNKVENNSSLVKKMTDEELDVIIARR